MKLFEPQTKNIGDSTANNSVVSLQKVKQKNNQKEYCRRITTQYYTSGIKLPVSKADSENMRYIRNWEIANGNKSLID